MLGARQHARVAQRARARHRPHVCGHAFASLCSHPPTSFTSTHDERVRPSASSLSVATSSSAASSQSSPSKSSRRASSLFTHVTQPHAPTTSDFTYPASAASSSVGCTHSPLYSTTPPTHGHSPVSSRRRWWIDAVSSARRRSVGTSTPMALRLPVACARSSSARLASTVNEAQETLPAQRDASMMRPSARSVISFASPLKTRMVRCSPAFFATTTRSAAVALYCVNESTAAVSSTDG